MSTGKNKLEQIEIAETAASLFAQLPEKEVNSDAPQVRAVMDILRANPDLAQSARKISL